MKRLLASIASLAMILCLSACGGQTAKEETKQSSEQPQATPAAPAETTAAGASVSEATAGQKQGLKIGFAVQTLSNQVWAQQAEAIKASAQKDGNEVTVVDCKENANTQIDQLENFITSGMDVIIVNPVDAQAIEETCKKAREDGILIMSWDEEMENSDINWLIKNYDLGAKIGEEAAKWIKETFKDQPCEVVVLGYPQIPILLQRENGIVDQLAKLAPNASVVANQPAIDTTEGLNAMENILEAHPDIKAVCCIGGGGAAGANEALKGRYGASIPNDVGIFSTDLTNETIASIQNGEFSKVCVAITGNAVVCGEVAYNLAVDKASGAAMEKNIYRELIPVTADNLKEMVSAS